MGYYTDSTPLATGHICFSLLFPLLGVPLATDPFKGHLLGSLASSFSLGLLVGSSSKRQSTGRKRSQCTALLPLFAAAPEVAAPRRWLRPGGGCILSMAPASSRQLSFPSSASHLISNNAVFPLVSSDLGWHWFPSYLLDVYFNIPQPCPHLGK